jgi:hypothetical protein
MTVPEGSKQNESSPQSHGDTEIDKVKIREHGGYGEHRGDCRRGVVEG